MATKIEHIQGRIVRPLGTESIHGWRKGVVTIQNPNFVADSTEEPHKKYLNVYFSKWAGLKAILTRNRTLVFEGYFTQWQYNDLGTVFVCQGVRELTFDDVTPIQTQTAAPELEF